MRYINLGTLEDKRLCSKINFSIFQEGNFYWHLIYWCSVLRGELCVVVVSSAYIKAAVTRTRRSNWPNSVNMHSVSVPATTPASVRTPTCSVSRRPKQHLRPSKVHWSCVEHILQWSLDLILIPGRDTSSCPRAVEPIVSYLIWHRTSLVLAGIIVIEQSRSFSSSCYLVESCIILAVLWTIVQLTI